MDTEKRDLPPELHLDRAPGPAEERKGSIVPKWTRVNRREPIGRQPWTAQEKGEQDAMRDLEKPIEQLLADVHEQAFKEHDPEKSVAYLLEAQRRMVSMMARVAISNELLNKRVLCLTYVIAVLTAVGVLIAAATFW